METILVRVTQEIIDRANALARENAKRIEEGLPEESYGVGGYVGARCPLTLALREASGDPAAGTNFRLASANGEKYEMPEQAIEFHRAWGLGEGFPGHKPVSPAEFTFTRR